MDEIATALGYAFPGPPPPSPERRREILEALEAGKVSAEKAAQMLRGWGEDEEE
jgi:hypothetical protein